MFNRLFSLLVVLNLVLAVNVVRADAWKDMQPKIELHKWPDVAHWPMIDVPDRVAKVILDRY